MKQVVYVANPESQQIHVWQLSDRGELNELQKVAIQGQVQPMVISPDSRYLYVGIRPEFGIISWRIMADGQLEQCARAPLPASPTHITTDLHGRFLFCASYNGNCISVSPVDHDGLVCSPIQQIEGLLAPHSVNINPDNSLLWVPCLKEDRVRVFNLSIDGRLEPHTPMAVNTAVGAGPRHMVFHPEYATAYCVNELHSSVDVYQISKNGRYRLTQTLDAMPTHFTDTRWAADIHITPDGRYLYTSDRTASILSVFRITQDGKVITLIGHHQTEAQPRGFNIDHSGKFLIASGQKSDHIVLYRIEQESGQLVMLARYPVGKGAMWNSVLALKD